MFTTTPLTRTKQWRQTKCPSTDEGIQMWGVQRNTIQQSKMSSEACYHSDQPQQRKASGKKPDAKEHTSHDFVYMKGPEQPNTGMESSLLVD